MSYQTWVMIASVFVSCLCLVWAGIGQILIRKQTEMLVWILQNRELAARILVSSQSDDAFYNVLDHMEAK